MHGEAKKVTKIAILGSASQSRLLAPYDDPSWQIWACSPANINELPRIDVWFEMHDLFRIRREWQREEPVFGWVNSQQFQVFMQETNDIVPRAQRYPIEMILKHFGGLADQFFDSTVAYMITLALAKYSHEPDFQFGMWGVNMAGDGEYGNQKKGLLHWLDWAEQRHLKYYVPPESSLLSPPIMYGYSEGNHMAIELKAQMEEFEKRWEKIQDRKAQVLHEEAFLDGVRKNLAYINRTWIGAENVTRQLPESPSSDARSEHGRGTSSPDDTIHSLEERRAPADYS